MRHHCHAIAAALRFQEAAAYVDVQFPWEATPGKDRRRWCCHPARSSILLSHGYVHTSVGVPYTAQAGANLNDIAARA